MEALPHTDDPPDIHQNARQSMGGMLGLARGGIEPRTDRSVGNEADEDMQSLQRQIPLPVSYTHLTLPTKRIV